MTQLLDVGLPETHQATIKVGDYPVRHRNPDCLKHGFRGRVTDLLFGGTIAEIVWDELKGGPLEVGQGREAYLVPGNPDRLPLQQIEMAMHETVIVLVGSRALQPGTLSRMFDLAELKPVGLLTTPQSPLADSAMELARRLGIPLERADSDQILAQAANLLPEEVPGLALVGMKGGTHTESKAIALEAIKDGWNVYFPEPEQVLGEIRVKSRADIEMNTGHYIGSTVPGVPRGPLSNPHWRATNGAVLFNEKELQPAIANQVGKVYQQINILSMQVADGQDCLLVCDCPAGGGHVCHGGFLALEIQQKALVML